MNMYPPIPDYDVGHEDAHVAPLNERVNGRQACRENRSPQEKDALIAELKEEVNELKKNVEKIEQQIASLNAINAEQEMLAMYNEKSINSKPVDINTGPAAAPPIEETMLNKLPAHPLPNEHASTVPRSEYTGYSNAPTSSVERKYGHGYLQGMSEPLYHERQNYDLRYQGEPYAKHNAYYYRRPPDYAPSPASGYTYAQHQEAYHSSQQQELYHPSVPHSYHDPAYNSRGNDGYYSNVYGAKVNGYNQSPHPQEMYINSQRGYAYHPGNEAFRGYGSHPQVEESNPNPNERINAVVPPYAQEPIRRNESIDPRAFQSQYAMRGPAPMENERPARGPERNEGSMRAPYPAVNERLPARQPLNQGSQQISGYLPHDQGGPLLSSHPPRDLPRQSIPKPSMADQVGQVMLQHPPPHQVDPAVPSSNWHKAEISKTNERHSWPPASSQFQQNVFSKSAPIPQKVQRQAPRSANVPKIQNAGLPIKNGLPPNSNEGRGEGRGDLSSQRRGSPSYEAQKLKPPQRRRENNPYINQDRPNSSIKAVPQKSRPNPEHSINQHNSYVNRGQQISGVSNNSSKKPPPGSSGGAKRFGGQKVNGKPGIFNKLAPQSSKDKLLASRPPKCPNKTGYANIPPIAKSRPPNKYSQQPKSGHTGQSGDGVMPQQQIVKGLVMGPHDPTQKTVREEFKFPAKNKKRRASGRSRGGFRGRGGGRIRR